MRELGTLTRLDPREIWPDEARDFTPWLAANLSKLAEVLGMELELEGHEAPVGGFSLDLLARDLGRDRLVVIENQFGATNHDHLGKLLTYAAGFDAGAAIWIAGEFREQHRQGLDWLNRRTGIDTDFFGLVVEVLQIDQSRPAYNLKLVAAPSEWSGERRPPAGVSPRSEAYRAFFQDLLDRLRQEHRFTTARAAQPQNWYSFATGISGVKYAAVFALGGRFRTEIYIDMGDVDRNKALFDRLAESRENLEAAFGEKLEWERLDDKRASRIAVYRDGTIDSDPETLTKIRDWAIERLLKLRAVFGPEMTRLVDEFEEETEQQPL